MTTITLQGGPADGRTLHNVPDCAWIHVPSAWPCPMPSWGGEQSFPAPPPVFYDHAYDARTGIYHHGRMPSERIRFTVSLFSPRLTRLLDHIDRRFNP